MKNFVSFCFVLAVFIISSCSNYKSGELTGVEGRTKFYEPEPFGMVFVPQGSFNMGPSDQDVAWAQTSFSKTVTIDPFWMDETEITNNEYRQFIFWVRDSIMRRMLGEQLDDYVITEDGFGNPIEPPAINWETKIYEGYIINNDGDKIEIKDRSSFIIRDIINVYPDTLCWIADFTYAFNEPYTTMYFWHPSYDNYPFVGVSWKQATAFCIWRTQLLNDALAMDGHPGVHPYRLPLEGEWEYASRGNLEHSMYPWGGYYTRKKEGCFLANFKPLRGNYADDGGVVTVPVGTYQPNEFNLYDMAGNVAEWTSTAFDESAYMFSHDLNPDYRYNASPDDPPVMKRKVIRGGSWKDIAFFLQNGTRSYEYQDTSKSYIGFRCVRSYMGT